MSFNVIHTCGFSPCAEGQGTRHTQSVKLPMSRARWAKSKRSFWLAPEILRGSSRFGAALANTYGFLTDSPLMNMQVYFCPVCHFSWMAWLKQIIHALECMSKVLTSDNCLLLMRRIHACLARHRYEHTYIHIYIYVCNVRTYVCMCVYDSWSFPNSKSLGLLTLKADGHHRFAAAVLGRVSRCLAGVSVRSRCCLGGLVMSAVSGSGVSLVPWRSCLGGWALVVSQWCLVCFGDSVVSVVSKWCLGRALAWCLGGFSMVLHQRSWHTCCILRLHPGSHAHVSKETILA